jgi:hypothetical protein
MEVADFLNLLILIFIFLNLYPHQFDWINCRLGGFLTVFIYKFRKVVSMKKVLFTLILCGLTSYGQSSYWKKSTQNFSNNKVS